jgi:F-type H+-transporting ATPase subunit b
MKVRRLSLAIVLGVLLSLAPSIAARAVTRAQGQSSEAAQQSPQHKSVAGELAKEERAAMGEEEENQNLKHSNLIKKFARLTGMTDHQAHMLALALNFALVVFLIYWFGRKFVPAAMRNRTAAIQRALEEARAASEDAGRRLSEIEARLQKLDSEVTQMQATAEKESESEEARIQAAAEEDIRKVVEAAEQEIAAAAKQARRELTSHTAELAVALARKQIQVDPATDQVLVRNFAGKLSSGGGKDPV